MAEVLELIYDVFTLPTAQHRAGLAGLYVVADTMRRRGMADVPEVALEGVGGLRLSLTQASLTALLNYLYDATTEEVRDTKVRKKRGGEAIPALRQETETRTDARTGRETIQTVYIYPKAVPRTPFLESLGMPASWQKLWRDAIWSTLRVKPTSRGPYEQRAGGVSVKATPGVWRQLTRWKTPWGGQRSQSAELSGTLLIGAMEHNAEGVEFRGSPDQNLLLHFWPAVMGLGEIWRTEREHDGYVEKPAGYVITVPDVLDVEWFCEAFERHVAGLDTRMFKWRPRTAVLALPEEGGLEYLHHLVALAAARAQAGEVRYAVAGMEVYHLQGGDNVRMLATGRVPVSDDLLRDYESIRDRYHDLAFRGQLIRSLLHGRPWYDGFDRLFARGDRDLFVGQSALIFAADARRRFRSEFDSVTTEEGDGDKRY